MNLRIFLFRLFYRQKSCDKRSDILPLCLSVCFIALSLIEGAYHGALHSFLSDLSVVCILSVLAKVVLIQQRPLHGAFIRIQ